MFEPITGAMTRYIRMSQEYLSESCDGEIQMELIAIYAEL